MPKPKKPKKAPEPDVEYVKVLVAMRRVEWSELREGDQVWAVFPKGSGFSRGPFRVSNVEEKKVRNMSGVELMWPYSDLPLVPSTE